jgi:hypothetical protein
MLHFIDLYSHPGQRSQGLAALVNVQQNSGEYLLRGSQLKVADCIALQYYDLHRRLPQIAYHFLEHYSDRSAEVYGCDEIASEALLGVLQPWYQPCSRRPGLLAHAPLSVHPCQLLADVDGQHHHTCQERHISSYSVSRCDVPLGIRRAIWQMQRLVTDKNAPKVTPWTLTG